MSDSFYKKQLEEFGIESVRIVPGDIDKKRQAEQAEVSKEVVMALMDTVQGRRWMYGKLDTCMVSGCVFVPQKPELTTFLLGAQWAGQQLLREIMDVAPEKYYIMISEESARRVATEQNQPD